MQKFEIVGDGIYSYDHVEGCDESICRCVLIMDKETFVKAFKMWVLEEGMIINGLG